VSIILRPYQVDLVGRARREMLRKIKSILMVAPTGAGKTSIVSHMLKTAHEKGHASIFIVHRRELVMQSALAFQKVGVPFGIISSGFMADYSQLVQIASIQTLANRLHLLRHKPQLIVPDEAHHTPAKSWAKVINSFPDAYKIGVTATPERLDGLGLGDYFDSMILGPTVSDLIKAGYLSDYKIYAASSVDLSQVHTRMGDYVNSELASIMDKPKLTGDAIKEYQRRAPGKRAVVFCVNIEHSLHVAQQFNEAGIRAEHIDGGTDSSHRDAVLKKFAAGEVKVITNVNLLGEGFDCPSIECCILLRPTKSLGFYLQMVGRALRPSPGKKFAIILDHVRACVEHGMPDQDRTWSLEGNRRKEKGEPSVKICPVCFAALMAASSQCAECGNIFTQEKRNVDLQATDEELIEIDKERAKREFRKEQGQALDLHQLIELGKKRNYKKPEAWARFVFHARQKKKIGRG